MRSIDYRAIVIFWTYLMILKIERVTVSQSFRTPGRVFKNSRCIHVQHLQKQHSTPPAACVAVEDIRITGPVPFLTMISDPFVDPTIFISTCQAASEYGIRCQNVDRMPRLIKTVSQRLHHRLLIHPNWLNGD